jgi:Type I phosphodiesterase / nucleotide pyrophosphatase
VRLHLSRRALAAAAALVVVAGIAVFAYGAFARRDSVPSFRAQACGLPSDYLELTKHGYFEPRSGQIAIVPRQPAYMASGAGGWSHSGPWPYLQEIPLVFFGPGILRQRAEVDRPVTMADVAPTLAALMGDRSFEAGDGRVLDEVLASEQGATSRPKLIVTVVWDGGGWNTLHLWDHSWPNLERLMNEGVTFTHATDGSSPSVTPAVHTTLGTGDWPWKNGITGVPVRDESGEVVDSFLQGESSHFIRVPALAEQWDEANDNEALIGMVGYEPWHLGMIGQGGERTGGDQDDAAWLDIDTNDWITNPDYYTLPPSLPATKGLDDDIAQLDAADGKVDGAWRDKAILDDPSRLEETPAWVRYHTRGMLDMISDEGYGKDGITDLLFTNYKQIDRVGHYFNMASPLVDDALVTSDEELQVIIDGLDREVGKGNWVMVVTADHGQQPDAPAIDGYGISPREIEADIKAEFGDVVRAVWPTEVFLLDDAMKEQGVTVDEIARFLGAYRLEDNTSDPLQLATGAGVFEPADRLFEMAIPSGMLETVDCSSRG